MIKLSMKEIQKSLMELIPQNGFYKTRTGDSGFIRRSRVAGRNAMKPDSIKESRRLNLQTTNPITSSREKMTVFGKTTPMYHEIVNIEGGTSGSECYGDLNNDVYGRTLPEERSALQVIKDEFMKNGF